MLVVQGGSGQVDWVSWPGAVGGLLDGQDRGERPAQRGVVLGAPSPRRSCGAPSSTWLGAASSSSSKPSSVSSAQTPAPVGRAAGPLDQPGLLHPGDGVGQPGPGLVHGVGQLGHPAAGGPALSDSVTRISYSGQIEPELPQIGVESAPSAGRCPSRYVRQTRCWSARQPSRCARLRDQRYPTQQLTFQTMPSYSCDVVEH